MIILSKKLQNRSFRRKLPVPAKTSQVHIALSQQILVKTQKFIHVLASTERDLFDGTTHFIVLAFVHELYAEKGQLCMGGAKNAHSRAGSGPKY